MGAAQGSKNGASIENNVNIFADLQPTIGVFTVYMFRGGISEIELSQEALENIEIQYKSDDGHFLLKIIEKESKEEIISIQCKPKSARLKIIPDNTQKFIINKNTLAFRFQLDKTHLGIMASNGQTPIYEGENCLQKIKNVDSMSCKNCKNSLIKTQNTPIRLRQCPQVDWQGVADLWQCHEESYDQFFDEKTKQLRVPDNTLLTTFNSILIQEQIQDSLDGVDVESQDFVLKCKSCNQIVGFSDKLFALAPKIEPFSPCSSTSRQQASLPSQFSFSIFAECISELDQANIDKGSTFEDRVKVLLHNHCIESKQKNIFFVTYTQQGGIKAFSVKLLSNVALILYDNKKDLTTAIKCLYSRVNHEIINQNILQQITFMRQISETKVVSETEFAQIESLLEQGNKITPSAIRSQQNGLSQLSYILHINQ